MTNNATDKRLNRRDALRRLTLAAAGLAAFELSGERTDAAPSAKTYEQCAAACLACEKSCAACTHHCAKMVAAGMAQHKKSLAASRDCGETCALVARFCTRRAPATAAICRACIDSCRLCSAECKKYPDMAVMVACVRENAKCIQACRAMIAALAA